ncbi:MAG: hypothetical protein PHS45_04535, partial [Bacilli bacterium]|nr:hypothetical protein [Bacilli bacterium]
MGASSVVFTGGEATLYKDLKKVVEYAKRECKLDVKLYTMCYRTNDNIKLLNELTKLGVDEIIYSTALNLVQRDSVSTYNLDEFINKLSRTINSELSFHHAITNETIGNVKEVCEMVSANTYYKNRGKISLLRYVPHGRGT